MHKRKHFNKEVIWLSLFVLLLTIVVRQGNRLFATAFNRVVFPSNMSIFENFKVYFTSITLLVIFEYFIVFGYPNNYLLSRVVGALVMMGITTIMLALYYWAGGRRLSILLLYAVNFFSIIGGQAVSYLIQRQKEYRLSLFLGLTQYLFIASLIIILTSVTPSGFIFSWFR